MAEDQAGGRGKLPKSVSRGRGRGAKGGRGPGGSGTISQNSPSSARSSLPTTSQSPSTHLNLTPEDDPSTSPIADQSSVQGDDDFLLGPTYDDPDEPPTSKKILQPIGNDEYLPSGDGTAAFTNVLKMRLKHPYTSWSKVPLVEKQSWFEEWKKYVYWDPIHDGHMFTAFLKRGRVRMPDIYYTIRGKGVKPNWMLDSVYEPLREYWNGGAFATASVRGKANRASSSGTANYAGGSQSINTRIAMKESKTKTKMGPLDIFRDNYIKKADRDKDISELPEGLARDDMIHFNKLKAEQEQRLLEDPDYPAKTDNELWTEVKKPNKRGEVVCLNKRRKAPILISSSCSTPCPAPPNLEFQELKQVVLNQEKTLKTFIENQAASQAASQAQMNESQEKFLASIGDMVKMFMGKGKGKRVEDRSEEENEDD